MSPSDDPNHDREFGERWLALFAFHGIKIRDRIENRDLPKLLFRLIFYHVPGFRIRARDISTPLKDSQSEEPALAAWMNLEEEVQRHPDLLKRKRQPPCVYDAVIDGAEKFYYEKKASMPTTSDVAICEMFIKSMAKKQRWYNAEHRGGFYIAKPHRAGWPYDRISALTLSRKLRKRRGEKSRP
jgi:hypothetical protein